jgi:L-asparaginase II
VIPRHVPLVVTTRGGATEGVHYGSVAVVDAGGRLVAGAGDPLALNFTRSALKPLQAMPFLEDGGMAHFGFGSHELALMCASHSGEAVHAAIVQGILARSGSSARQLQCGCHVPHYFAATGRDAPAGCKWPALQHNCSGKHSGFLAWCRMHDKGVVRYLDPAHPLQQRIAALVRRYARGRRALRGIDGCGAPNYALPLAGLAQLYGEIAAGASAEQRAIFYAMTRHPDLVSGTGRFDLALMRAGRGDWVTKAGAMGVHAIGVRSRGLGIAVRIADGTPYALQAATVAVLDQLGLPVAGLQAWRHAVTRNFAGRVTGGARPVFRLARRS